MPFSAGWLWVFLLWPAVSSVFAQDIPATATEQPKVISVEVPVVLSPVTLVRRNRPVEPVLASDIELRVDGELQNINGFGRDQWPLSLVLAVDVSGSIANILPYLRRTAEKVLTQLHPGDHIALLAFSRATRVVVPFTRDRERIVQELGFLEAAGGTALNDALFEATTLLAAESGARRRVVLFLTDNLAMPANEHSDGEAIRKAQEEGVLVLGIHLPAGEEEERLVRLLRQSPSSPRIRYAMRHAGNIYRFAEETAGEVLRIRKEQQIESGFRRMIQRIQSQYYISFQPPLASQEKKERTISIRLTREGRKRIGSAEIRHRRLFRF